MDKEELIHRQKEIIRTLGAKPKKRGRKSEINQTHRIQLNQELREINKKLKAFPDYQRKTLTVTARKKRNKKKRAERQEMNPMSAAEAKDRKRRKQLARSKYDIAPGTWIHVWRG